MDKVTVIEIRLTRKPGPLRAFADAQIGNVIVTDFRVFQENGEQARVEMPTATWRDTKNRELRFKPVITLPGDLKGRIESEILSCYYRAMERNENDPKDE